MKVTQEEIRARRLQQATRNPSSDVPNLMAPAPERRGIHNSQLLSLPVSLSQQSAQLQTRPPYTCVCSKKATTNAWTVRTRRMRSLLMSPVECRWDVNSDDGLAQPGRWNWGCRWNIWMGWDGWGGCDHTIHLDQPRYYPTPPPRLTCGMLPPAVHSAAPFQSRPSHPIPSHPIPSYPIPAHHS